MKMMMGSAFIAFAVLFVGVTLSLPLKNNEVEDYVMRPNDMYRFAPYSDEDRSLYVERSLDSIGGGNLIRSVNMNDLSDNLVHPRQHVRRSAMPEGFDNDWNLAAERRNSYRYAWPKYGSIHTNFRRALDSIGGGHLLKRTLDSIGGANLIRK